MLGVLALGVLLGVLLHKAFALGIGKFRAKKIEPKPCFTEYDLLDLTEVWLIRHGETESNAERRWQGQKDTPLNNQGRNQAAALAKRLSEEHRFQPFDKIFSSPLARAHETASIIGGLLDMNVDTDPRLMEINLGELEGEKIQRGVPAKWDPHLKMGGTGESFLDVQDRMVGGIEDISKRNPGKKIIIVSHGAAIRTYLTCAFGVPLERIGAFVVGNCSISQLRPFQKHNRADHRGVVLRYNDNAHVAKSN